MPRRTVATAALTVVLSVTGAACGEGPAEPPAGPPVTEEPGAEDGEDADADADEVTTIEGTLGGDPQLEGGCVWVDADQRYEVQWPDGYEASADPVELRGPDGEVVASQGDAVRVRGREAPDMMSICQVGPIFTAESVEAG